MVRLSLIIIVIRSPIKTITDNHYTVLLAYMLDSAHSRNTMFQILVVICYTSSNVYLFLHALWHVAIVKDFVDVAHDVIERVRKIKQGCFFRMIPWGSGMATFTSSET
jgi:hypothetical protein